MHGPGDDAAAAGALRRPATHGRGSSAARRRPKRRRHQLSCGEWRRPEAAAAQVPAPPAPLIHPPASAAPRPAGRRRGACKCVSLCRAAVPPRAAGCARRRRPAEGGCPPAVGTHPPPLKSTPPSARLPARIRGAAAGAAARHDAVLGAAPLCRCGGCNARAGGALVSAQRRPQCSPCALRQLARAVAAPRLSSASSFLVRARC